MLTSRAPHTLRLLSLLVLLAVLLLALHSAPTASADGVEQGLVHDKREHVDSDHKRHIDRPCKDKHDEREECRRHRDHDHDHDHDKDKHDFHPAGFEQAGADVREDGDRGREEQHDKRHHDKHHRREHRHDFEVKEAVSVEGEHDKHHHKRHHHHNKDGQADGAAAVAGHRDDHGRKHKHHHSKHDDDTSSVAEVVAEGNDRCKDDRYKNDEECRRRGREKHGKGKHHFEPTGVKHDRARYCRDDKHRNEKVCRKDKHDGHRFLPKFLQALMA